MLAERRRPIWKRYDATVVDEGQDFDANWWPLLEPLLAHPERDSLFVFYDDNQQVYRRKPGLPSGIRTMPLTINFRTTRAIQREIVGFYAGEIVPRPIGAPGEHPQFREYPEHDREGLRQCLRRLLAELRHGNVPTEHIVVLTPHAKDSTMLAAWERELGLTPTSHNGLVLWDYNLPFQRMGAPGSCFG